MLSLSKELVEGKGSLGADQHSGYFGGPHRDSMFLKTEAERNPGFYRSN